MNILSIAKELCCAHIAQRNITAASLDGWLARTHDTLLMLWQAEQTSRDEPMANPIDWRLSIKTASIICLECGKTYKQLVTNHLRKHGLDAADYRRKHGMPPDVSLASKTVSRRRREIAKTIKPWQKARRK